MILPPPAHPKTFGLFQKRIEGDDSLLELARLRFQQAGMGAEMHAGTPDELDWMMKFRPLPETRVMAHLARDIQWAEPNGQTRIEEFAARFAGRVQGLVVHDRIEMASRPEEFLRAARELESRLARIQHGPVLHIEYAAGLEPAAFAGFCESIRELTRISACIDVGHVGIFQVRRAYSQLHSGEDICALKSESHKLPGVIADVEKAVSSALPEVLKLIEAFGRFGKPVHFHLHDGHPLSRFSPFGVSDHLSFLDEIPIAFEHRGRRSLPLMFGVAGLSAIAAKAVEVIGPGRASFTIEIHPRFERLPLGDAAGMFTHWRDKTNAEQMNHWLGVLGRNHDLLLSALTRMLRDVTTIPK